VLKRLAGSRLSSRRSGAVACRTHGTSGGGWNPPLGIHADWHVGSSPCAYRKLRFDISIAPLKRRDASRIARSVIIDHPSSPAVFGFRGNTGCSKSDLGGDQDCLWRTISSCCDRRRRTSTDSYD
jgi:hypothetical protein